jgi:glucosamine 6-phosphate synthetase-like amidotransferase/phosphosugar isomerase protein
MCGIFAWSGSKPELFNKSKFDILGIYNDSRGGDSCGVSTDGEIYYGVTTNCKKYSQFLFEKNYLLPNKFPTVIGHTRKSSVGSVNTENAHPFGFGVNNLNDSYEFVGVEMCAR